MSDSSPQPFETSDHGKSAAEPLPASAQSAGTPVAWARWGAFLLLIAASVAIFWPQLTLLYGYMSHFRSDKMPYSYCLAIPALSAVLIVFERKRIFANVQYDVRAGSLLLAVGLVADWIGQRAWGTIGAHNSTVVAVLGLVIFWIGAFMACFGPKAFRAAQFSLIFLLLTIPPPPWLIGLPISFVQHGSADVASIAFTILDVPVFRSGLYFSLPGLTIQVAEECSGIHSIMALLALSLLAGHLTLLSNWRRVILTALVFPIVCFTNGLRIAILTMASNYWDPRFMYGRLHREGGVLFFLLGMGLLMFFLHWMDNVKPPRRPGDRKQG